MALVKEQLQYLKTKKLKFQFLLVKRATPKYHLKPSKMIKGTSGTITIAYIDEEGIEQVIQGDVDRLKVTNDGNEFVLRGDLFGPGWDPNRIVDYVLQGQIDQETGVTTLQLKAEQGVTGAFESQDTQVSIIGPG
jgi:hypothetical protein